VSLLRDVVLRVLLEAAARRADWPRRLLLCHYGARLGSLGLNAGTTGNLSLRLRDGSSIYITPRGVEKACLEPRQIRRVSLTDHGPGAADASSEFPLHRASYLARDDIGAVVHAHPPALTALPLRGLDLTATLPESGVALGGVTQIPYAPAGSDSLAQLVGSAIRGGASLLLLERHGAVAVGGTLGEACRRLEQGELAALTTLMADGARGDLAGE
jgi:L-fuculose-phosphate aldolase